MSRYTAEAAIVAKELASRNVPIILKTVEDIMNAPFPNLDASSDLVAGNPEFVRRALQQLGLSRVFSFVCCVLLL